MDVPAREGIRSADASTLTSFSASSGGVHGASSPKLPTVMAVRTSPGLKTKTGIRPLSSRASVSP